MDQPTPQPKPKATKNQRNRIKPLSDAEITTNIETIVASLRTNPARIRSVLSLATGRAGSRQIVVQTGECQSLTRALQDLDRVMLYASSRSLFAKPETVRELSNARDLVSEAANKILESIAALAHSSGFDVSTLNAPEIRRILMDRRKEEKAKAQSAAKPETSTLTQP